MVLPIDVPVEEYTVSSKQVFVVRDDLCCPFPGNNNSKTRGIYQFMRGLDADIVGIVDTPVSRGGWGVAWVGKLLNKKVYVYVHPKYMDDFYRKMAKLHGAVIIPNDKGKLSRITYNMAKKDVERKGGKMLPLYLTLRETADEVEKVALHVFSKYDVKTVVVSVGRGTIASGIIRALEPNVKVYGIAHADFNVERGYRYIEGLSGKKGRITLVTLPYKYGQANYNPPPFPCDLYYDRWAWEWLASRIDALREPVVFWNVGGEWHRETGLFPSFRGDGRVTREEVARWLEGGGLVQQIPS
jgi:hypothetical protein